MDARDESMLFNDAMGELRALAAATSNHAAFVREQTHLNLDELHECVNECSALMYGALSDATDARRAQHEARINRLVARMRALRTLTADDIDDDALPPSLGVDPDDAAP